MRARLNVTGPDGRRVSYDLADEGLSLGRSSANSIAFPDEPRLSRRHALIEPSADGWIVRDLGSRNGTFVNDEPLLDARALKDGDRVRAARVELRFEAMTAAEPAPEPDLEPEIEQEGTVGIGTAESRQVESLAVATQFARLDAILQSGQMAALAPDARARRWTSPAMALLRAGRELANPRPLGELFPKILDLAMEAVAAERGLLLTLDDGALVERARRGGPDLRLGEGVREQVLGRKLSVIIRDVLVDPRWKQQHSIVSQGIRSVLAAPLQTDDRAIGILYLDSGESREFSSEDLELITVMANIAAVRIEHERLAAAELRKKFLETELEQAAEIQRQCLPEEPPEVEGLELAGVGAPCRGVGGDYYDFVCRPDGKLVVVISDVAGKGMPAALLVMNLQARIEALADTFDDPARMMMRLNVMLDRVCPANRFVTCIVALIDPATGEMRFANAGHDPGLLLDADGRLDRLEASGPPLGILPMAEYSSGTRMLAPGSVLLLHTDGVTEASNAAGEEFGVERLEALVRATATFGAAELADGLVAEVTRWAGGQPQHDDITVVAVRRPNG